MRGFPFHENFSCAGVATSLSLTVPAQVLKAKASDKKASKSKTSEPSGPTDLWYAEFAQRLLSAAAETSHGYFFESWRTPQDDEVGARGLKACLDKGWVNLSAEVQVMQPTGGTHKATLVYLHGYMCDGCSYLLEPRYFYRPKAQKKKSKGKKADKSSKTDRDGEEDDDDIEYEPYPGLKVVLPTAPTRKITCHGGTENTAWHDYITDYNGEMEDQLAMEHVEEQTRRIHAIIDAEVALVGSRNVFVGGASQGCGMALHAALTYPGDLGAIIGTMGHVLSCTEVTTEWIARKIPVYNYIGDSDTIMPWEKWVKATWQRLEDAGAEVHTHLEPGVDHAESEEKWTRAFLKDRMSPATVKSAAKKKAGKK